LSAESQAAADALSPSLDLKLPLADMFLDKAGLDEAESALQWKIQTLFAANNINTANRIDLQIGFDGQVVVSNDNPQKAEIEQLFKDNPRLRDDFAKFSAQTSLYEAGQEAIAFQKAYARDPVAAVAQFSYLFNATAKPTVSFSMQGDSYQTLIEYPGGKTVEL
jgi:hypothetical protein